MPEPADSAPDPNTPGEFFRLDLTPRHFAGLTPADLDDPAKFRRVARVPILDVHDHDEKGNVDLDLLRLLAGNTNRRCDRGDLVAVTIGHTREDAREQDQPPFVGYAKGLAVGEFRDEPCLFADLYLRAEDADEALRYPHRSIERVRSPDPDQNYIDYVCLLRRPPERSLGLLTYSRTLGQGCSVVRYGRDAAAPPRADAAPGPDSPVVEPETPPVSPEGPAPMTPEEIQAVATAVAAALSPAFDKIAAALMPPAPPVEAEPGATPPAPVADAPPEAERVQNEEASPSGDNAFVPEMIKKDDDPARVQMQQSITTLTRRLDMLSAENARLKYEREFDALEKEGVAFDRAQELSAILDLPPKNRDGHVTRMRTQYKRTSVGQGGHIPTAEPAEPDAAPTPSDRQGIIDTATKYGISDWNEARVKYQEDKRKRA